MTIGIRKCEEVAGGCKVAVSQDGGNAVGYFREVCAQHGWQVTDRPAVPGMEAVAWFFVKGPSRDEFRAALESDREFDFSRLVGEG